MLFQPEFVDLADEEKHDKGNYDKTDDRIHEHTAVERDRTGLLNVDKGGIRSRGCVLFENCEKVGEVNITLEQADRWHDDVGDE